MWNLSQRDSQDFFSGKRGAGTHKRGKDNHTESFVTISLYNITVYFITSQQ
jgi:hypothetical protein